MNKVVSHVVANISKYASTENCSCRIPIVKEYSVGQLPKRYGKDYKQGWRQDEAIFVHRKVVVNTVKREMQSDSNPIVRKISAHSSALNITFQQSVKHSLVEVE